MSRIEFVPEESFKKRRFKWILSKVLISAFIFISILLMMFYIPYYKNKELERESLELERIVKSYKEKSIYKMKNVESTNNNSLYQDHKQHIKSEIKLVSKSLAFLKIVNKNSIKLLHLSYKSGCFEFQGITNDNKKIVNLMDSIESLGQFKSIRLKNFEFVDKADQYYFTLKINI